MKTKREIEIEYCCPVYVQWRLVPQHLGTRAYFKNLGVTIPKSAKPDAVKGGGGYPRISFLFDERKYLDEKTLKNLAIARRPKL